MADSPSWTGWHTFGLLGTLVAVLVVGVLAPPFVAWLLTMLLLVVFLAVAGQGVTGEWRGALIDDRNRMSLSRFQMCAWTVLILAGFLAAALSNVALGDVADPVAVGIPEQLWLLMGISTTSLVGSPLIRSTKRERKPDAEQAERTFRQLAHRRGIAASSDAKSAQESVEMATRGVELVNLRTEDAAWSDLVRGEEVGNGASLDLGKVQNLYFTVVLLIAYAVVLASALREGGPIMQLPDLDAGMIALLGISHAGYLTFKAVPHTREAQPDDGEAGGRQYG